MLVVVAAGERGKREMREIAIQASSTRRRVEKGRMKRRNVLDRG
jgi:autonomous glycyl radical cofactor GrcA